MLRFIHSPWGLEKSGALRVSLAEDDLTSADLGWSGPRPWLAISSTGDFCRQPLRLSVRPGFGLGYRNLYLWVCHAYHPRTTAPREDLPSLFGRLSIT